MDLHIIGRSKVFDLFPRTYKGKKRCVLRQKTRFDKFPRTNGSIRRSVDINLEQSSHIETVVLLSRKDVHERIRFDVNVEDLHGRVSSTATYPEIKAWVLETYGLKVSSKYIGQIKTKCGFEKRENFNKGNGKSRELICPPDKEKAIMEAFKHFGMLD